MQKILQSFSPHYGYMDYLAFKHNDDVMFNFISRNFFFQMSILKLFAQRELRMKSEPKSKPH